jgi:hypothetical protein
MLRTIVMTLFVDGGVVGMIFIGNGMLHAIGMKITSVLDVIAWVIYALVAVSILTTIVAYFFAIKSYGITVMFCWDCILLGMFGLALSILRISTGFLPQQLQYFWLVAILLGSAVWVFVNHAHVSAVVTTWLRRGYRLIFSLAPLLVAGEILLMRLGPLSAKKLYAYLWLLIFAIGAIPVTAIALGKIVGAIRQTAEMLHDQEAFRKKFQLSPEEWYSKRWLRRHQ